MHVQASWDNLEPVLGHPGRILGHLDASRSRLKRILETISAKLRKYRNQSLRSSPEQLHTTVLCDRGHANGPEPDNLKNVVCKNDLALRREHHFVKKISSSEADLRSRQWKLVHRCNGASTRAPKRTKKLKKLLWSYRWCWISKSECFSWECPKKYPKGISHGRPKASILAKSVRKNKVTQNFTKK